jgi:hypothetical protein
LLRRAAISARFLFRTIAISRSIHREIASLISLFNAISRDELAKSGDEAKKEEARIRVIHAKPALLPSQHPFAARIRRNPDPGSTDGRCAAIRRHRALSGVPVPDPVRF